VHVGGGLWSSVPLTIVLDAGVFGVGLWLYVRGTRASDRIGRWGLWSMVELLTGIFLGSISGPPPASERALAVGSLGLWLFVPWSYWVDRHRLPKGLAGADRSSRERRLRSSRACTHNPPLARLDASVHPRRTQ
jgi:hypothetical protein